LTKATTTLGAEERALCARLSSGIGSLDSPVLAAARRHRVHLLLAASLTPAERETADGAALGRDLTVASALHAWREDDTRELLDGLGANGISVLLLKGTGVAYTVYPAPHLRPRLDVDLLIRREALDATEQLLAAHGWTRPPERDAELSEPQRHYVKNGPGGILYHIDLHWKIANPRVFANALSFDELDDRAIHVPALGRSARTLGWVDALLVACLHRVAHHGDALDLLWLWDIHLLMERLSSADKDRFVALAERTNMRAVCARGLQLSGLLFETRDAVHTASRLETSSVGVEASARFVGGASAMSVLATDLITLPWRDRAQLLCEHLFPSSEYMREKYREWPDVLLPVAYLHRIVRGAPRWFGR
jgi:hypothetical protein